MERTSNAPQDKKRFKPGLGFLACAAAAEQTRYYGIRAILTMFLIQFFFDEHNSWQVMGYFSLACQLSAVIGALAVDFFLRNRRSLLWGGILNTIGCIAICVSSFMATPFEATDAQTVAAHNMPAIITFFVGLGAIVIGNGLFKPTLWASAGNLIHPTSQQRDGAFVLVALLMGIGGFFGPVLFGGISEFGKGDHFTLAFFIAAFVMAVSTVLIYLFIRISSNSGNNAQYKKQTAAISGDMPNKLDKHDDTNDVNISDNAQTISEPLYKSLLNGKGLIVSAIAFIITSLITFFMSKQVITSISCGLGVGMFLLIYFNRTLQIIDRKKIQFSAIMLFILIVCEFLNTHFGAVSVVMKPFFSYGSMVAALIGYILAFVGIIIFIVRSLTNHTNKSSFHALGFAVTAILGEIILNHFLRNIAEWNPIAGLICFAIAVFFTSIVDCLLFSIILSIITRMSPIRTSVCMVSVCFTASILSRVIYNAFNPEASLQALEAGTDPNGVAFIAMSVIATILYLVFKPKLEKSYERLMEENAS